SSTVLDARTGATILAVPGGFGALSDDGRYVATVMSGQLTVVEVDTESAVAVPVAMTIANDVWPRMSFDAGDRRLAFTDGKTKIVHVVDWPADQEVTEPIDLRGEFTFAQFLPDGRLFVRNEARAVVKDLDGAAASALVGIPGSRDMPWPRGANLVAFTA